MSFSTITILGQAVTLVQIPAKPGLKQVDWKYLDQVAQVRSVFNGQTQRQKWPGADMLAGTAHLPPLTLLQADAWETFLMQLRGRANAFQMGDPLRSSPRGSGTVFGNHPLVDNTVAWGNAAGSEMLGTKGWIANTPILKQGDWMQVGFRLYRVLDDVTSDASGNAVIPIWPTLREQPNNDGTSVGYLNAAGAARKFSSGTLGGYSFGCIWNEFSTPALPSDAVVQGIYPVIIASGTFDICFQYLQYGAGITFTSGGTPFTSPYGTGPIAPGASFASTEFYGASLGTSLGGLANQGILMAINSSLLKNPTADAINATAVGYAVYYTSATPVIDPQIAAPFTVPTGQGLAWSLPFAVELDISANNGTASGTAVADNGNIILNNPLGLFSLSSNERNNSVDIGRLAKTGFPFEEYR